MPHMPSPDFAVASSIAWFYLITNTVRGLTYIPQIVVVWRARDGARSLSLLTWSSWLVANFAAFLYGLVLHDAFFAVISLINAAGCATVTIIASCRRLAWRRSCEAVSGPLGLQEADSSPVDLPATVVPFRRQVQRASRR